MTTTHASDGSTRDLDAVVARLTAGARAWSQTSLTERRDLLLEVHAATSIHAEQWVSIAC